MSTPALEALHRVAHEIGIVPIDPPSALANKICQAIRELQVDLNDARLGLGRANHRLEILTPEDIP